jgi:DNA-binding NarL/FixJ family response regulator
VARHLYQGTAITIESDIIRVLIVEDDSLFRDLLSLYLSREERLNVVGRAVDGESAVKMARKLDVHYDHVGIEIAGQLNGIEAGLEIKKDSPETGILVLSAHKDRQYLSSIPLGQAPGWSYLLKQSMSDASSLVRAIEGSARGLVVLDPEVVAELRPKDDSLLANLTSRQLEVLELIAQGYNNSSIASRLHLEEKSVQNYINAIFQELQLSGEEDTHARVKATLLYLKETKAR